MKSLLKKIAEDDSKEAFSIFYRQHYEKLIIFALRFLPSHQDAEDVVAEVMIKLLKKRKKLHLIENLEGYLYFSVKNQSINFIKQANRKRAMPLEAEFDFAATDQVVPLSQIFAKELDQRISQVVRLMPPQRRLIFKMVKEDGLKHKEVGILLDISDKTVKKHIELAIRDLKQVIEQYYATPETPSTAENAQVAGIVSSLLLLLVQC